VRTGQPAFDKVFGMPVFEYFSKNAEAAAVFDTAMTSLSTMDGEMIAAAYDFTRIGTLMDVAGGQGLLLATLLQKHKKMRGILFDLPHVTAAASATFARAGVAARVLDGVSSRPSRGADAIIMNISSTTGTTPAA
jgi:hypothetical protein